MRRSRLIVQQSAGMALVVALVSIAAEPAQAAKKPRPDLVVAGKRTVNPKQLFFGEAEQVVRFNARIKNRGKGRAPASKALLILDNRASESDADAHIRLQVPALRSGKSFRGSARDAVKRSLKPGAYHAQICADGPDEIKETNDGNNCAKAGVIFIVARDWAGYVSGNAPVETGVNESWTAEYARFTYDKRLKPAGRVRYLFDGTLTYELSGTDSDGCIYTGSGAARVRATTPRPADEEYGLTVDYLKGQYWGTEVLTGQTFSYAVSCDGEQVSIDGPLDFAAGYFVIEPIDAKPINDPMVLVGVFREPHESLKGRFYRWLWNLTAQYPR